MNGRERIPVSIVVIMLVVIGAGCGEEATRYGDNEIVEKLNLEKSGNGYAIDGDPFCEVEGRLLNDSDEVDAAADREQLSLVIASREGGVGVQGVPPFAPDCRDTAKKKLNKLDPPPAD
jgi:hypothetical protein